MAPAAVLAAVGEERGTRESEALCERVGIQLEDLVSYRERTESPVRAGATRALSTRHGEFRTTGYVTDRDGTEHLALVRGDVTRGAPVPVRVHAECPTGEVLGSLQCSCADDLAASLDAIARLGRGVLIYLRGGHQPRTGPVLAGHGSSSPPERNNRVVAHILRDLGIGATVLLADDPGEICGLADFGVTVTDRIPVAEAALPAQLV